MSTCCRGHKDSCLKTLLCRFPINSFQFCPRQCNLEVVIEEVMGGGSEGTEEVRVGRVGAECSELRWEKLHGIYPKPPKEVQLAGEG